MRLICGNVGITQMKDTSNDFSDSTLATLWNDVVMTRLRSRLLQNDSTQFESQSTT